MYICVKYPPIAIKNFVTMTRINSTIRRARFSNKVRRSWCVREKLMVVHYLERHHSVRSTAKKFDIEYL